MTAVLDRPTTRGGASLWRLTVVELRKAVDTRSGRWLLIVSFLLCLGVGVLVLGWETDPNELGLRGFYAAEHGIAIVLLPVLGLLLATGEWSRRTALTTFALTPDRRRIIAAKAGAASLLAIVMSLVVLLFAVVLEVVLALGPEHGAVWDLGVLAFLRVTAVGVVTTLGGLGFGLALTSPALAIVLYFGLPTAMSVVTGTVHRLEGPLTWVDLNATLPPLYEAGATAHEWAQGGTSVLAWVALPLAVGGWLTMRREIS